MSMLSVRVPSACTAPAGRARQGVAAKRRLNVRLAHGSHQRRQAVAVPTVSLPNEPPTDLFSYMFRRRIIFLREMLTDTTASATIASLLALELQDPRAPIQLYINCPAASPYAAAAVVDTMRHVRAPVGTVALGQARGPGAVAILASGARGRRWALPHTRLVLHQASGGMDGSVADVDVAVKELRRTMTLLYECLADATGRSAEDMARECRRQRFLSAVQARDMGLVDGLVGEEPSVDPRRQWPSLFIPEGVGA